MHCAYVPERDAAGAVRGHIAVVTDVTARKWMEAQLEASLREKEVLLKEIHHRVKNNLQVISSLVSLQCSHLKDRQVLDALREVQNRVRSMALIHEQLYQSKDLARIDFAGYLRDLATHLFLSYGVDPEQIRLETAVAEIFLDVNTAILCGLVITELVSN